MSCRTSYNPQSTPSCRRNDGETIEDAVEDIIEANPSGHIIDGGTLHSLQDLEIETAAGIFTSPAVDLNLIGTGANVQIQPNGTNYIFSNSALDIPVQSNMAITGGYSFGGDTDTGLFHTAEHNPSLRANAEDVVLVRPRTGTNSGKLRVNNGLELYADGAIKTADIGTAITEFRNVLIVKGNGSTNTFTQSGSLTEVLTSMNVRADGSTLAASFGPAQNQYYNQLLVKPNAVTTRLDVSNSNTIVSNDMQVRPDGTNNRFRVQDAVTMIDNQLQVAPDALNVRLDVQDADTTVDNVLKYSGSVTSPSEDYLLKCDDAFGNADWYQPNFETVLSFITITGFSVNPAHGFAISERIGNTVKIWGRTTSFTINAGATARFTIDCANCLPILPTNVAVGFCSGTASYAGTDAHELTGYVDCNSTSGPRVNTTNHVLSAVNAVVHFNLVYLIR